MCDIGYLIKDHVPAVMQLLTNALPEYNMQMLTTKCLNTAVMMMYLMLGADGLRITRHCDVENVRKRHGRAPASQADIARDLRDEVMSTRTSNRALFYLMITDGDMPSQADPQKKVYFPGHVIVIEKLERGNFNLYQSYVNHYDLKGHIDDGGGGMPVGPTRMARLMAGLIRLMRAEVWDAGTSRDWRELTGVGGAHTQQFEGYAPRGVLLMCYKRVETNTCVSRLKGLLSSTLANLERVPAAERGKLHGRADMYAKGTRPMTVDAMIRNLSALSNKLL
jgi:hypothetical protein